LECREEDAVEEAELRKSLFGEKEKWSATP
jgi:hypothetical protein